MRSFKIYPLFLVFWLAFPNYAVGFAESTLTTIGEYNTGGVETAPKIVGS